MPPAEHPPTSPPAPDPQRALRTARLVLEPLAEAHADAMFDALADPRIYAHENAPPPSREWLRERYARLATRRSGDGSEWWLNWIVRLDGEAGACIGYVQASIAVGGGAATIAYEFGSRWWGLGLASEAVAAMNRELAAAFGATALRAVLKRSNARSERLLVCLGFSPADDAECMEAGIDDDERLLRRPA